MTVRGLNVSRHFDSYDRLGQKEEVQSPRQIKNPQELIPPHQVSFILTSPNLS